MVEAGNPLLNLIGNLANDAEIGVAQMIRQLSEKRFELRAVVVNQRRNVILVKPDAGEVALDVIT